MDPYYMTPVDHVRVWAAAHITWDTVLIVVAAAVALLPVVQVDRAARASGQGPVLAALTAGASLLLAAAAAREIWLRRRTAARSWTVCPWLAAPAALAAWCAALNTSEVPGRGAAGVVLAVWPMLCTVVAVAVQLGRPTLAATSEPIPEPPARQPEPTLSRAAARPEPAAHDDEPQVSGPPTAPTKRAQLLALAASVPATDQRGPSDLADDLAAIVGLHAATARRYLAEARRQPTAANAA